MTWSTVLRLLGGGGEFGLQTGLKFALTENPICRFFTIKIMEFVSFFSFY